MFNGGNYSTRKVDPRWVVTARFFVWSCLARLWGGRFRLPSAVRFVFRRGKRPKRGMIALSDNCIFLYPFEQRRRGTAQGHGIARFAPMLPVAVRLTPRRAWTCPAVLPANPLSLHRRGTARLPRCLRASVAARRVPQLWRL